MRVKICPADRLFSLYIRNRDKRTCQRCGKEYPEGSQGLENSHFWGRAREGTRFDELNCDALCTGCHQYLGANPAKYTNWKENRLGEKNYNLLMLRAHTYCKKDRKLAKLIIIKKLKKQEKE